MTSPRLTLLYDGDCPICRWEKRKLAAADRHGRLGFIDIQAEEFDPAVYGVDMKQLMGRLHGITGDGRMLIGVEVIIRSYRAVGWWWLHLPLSAVPRPLARVCYEAFAARRYIISRRIGHWFEDGCDDGVCDRWYR